MKHLLFYSSVFLFMLSSLSRLAAQNYDNVQQHQCLKCHSNQTYTFFNSLMEYEEKKLMNPYYIIDTVGLKTGVHSAFDCTDCHSYEYSEYPHKAAIKLEPLPTCLDCHGGSESDYQFEQVQEEFQKSVHYKIYGDNFNCAKCHDQHTYRPVARSSERVSEIVQFDNQMCLSCHNDMRRFLLVSGKENPEIREIHEWLPNQELHFANVRCIECHTEVKEGLMVSHNIRRKEEAVRNCVECHSENSRLKASLYKYQNLQQRSEDGTLSVIISNDSYVIGTQQIPFLRTLSFIILGLVFAGIGVHITLRIIKKK